jgi:voltage-gated potassium channel
MTSREAARDRPDLREERWELLRQLNALLDKPMIALSFVWLGLLILDLTAGLSRPLEILSYVIWALFGLQFALGLVIAPSKGAYLRQNWLTAISLLLPAFRVLRVFRVFRLLRAARATRSLSLLRLITSLNRGMRAIGSALGRRGVGYVAALTAIVTFGGAAGMAQFESPAALRESGYPDGEQASAGLGNYWEALWWTAMIMTTMGSEYWPKTVEGRILGWLLAVYALAIFGYIAATIASFFVGRDAATAQAPPAVDGVGSGEPSADPGRPDQAELRRLRDEIARLERLIERHLPESRPEAGDQQRSARS